MTTLLIAISVLIVAIVVDEKRANQRYLNEIEDDNELDSHYVTPHSKYRTWGIY